MIKMTLNDPLANVLSQIQTAEKKGIKKVSVPTSKIIKAVLTILNKHNYLGEFKQINTKQIEVNLLGTINKTGVIKPRHSVKLDNYEKFEKRYLLAYGFGYLLVSTNRGIMTQEEAFKNKLGGRLIAYVY